MQAFIVVQLQGHLPCPTPLPESPTREITPISLLLVYKDDEYNCNYYMTYKNQKYDLDNVWRCETRHLELDRLKEVFGNFFLEENYLQMLKETKQELIREE
ncbi:hypothetical protein Tco_0584112 [Tanacetum coccineum]